MKAPIVSFSFYSILACILTHFLYLDLKCIFILWRLQSHIWYSFPYYVCHVFYCVVIYFQHFGQLCCYLCYKNIFYLLFYNLILIFLLGQFLIAVKPFNPKVCVVNLYLSSTWSANIQKTLIKRPMQNTCQKWKKKNREGKRKMERVKAGLNVSHYLLQDLASLRAFRNMSHPLLRPALCGRSLTGSSILG